MKRARSFLVIGCWNNVTQNDHYGTRTHYWLLCSFISMSPASSSLATLVHNPPVLGLFAFVHVKPQVCENVPRDLRCTPVGRPAAQNLSLLNRPGSLLADGSTAVSRVLLQPG